MLNDFNRYAADVMDNNDVFQALNDDRPVDYRGEAADWYKREHGFNLEPADKRAQRPAKAKKPAGKTGSLAGRTHRLQTEGVK